MTDVEILGEFYADKYFRDIQAGRDPVIEDYDVIDKALAQWEKEDAELLDQMDEARRLRQLQDDESEWEEIKL